LRLRFVVCGFAMSLVALVQPASTQELARSGGTEQLTPEKRTAHENAARANALVSSGTSKSASPLKRKPAAVSSAKGPYYVDFRSRTAATYGHAFVWFGKTTERQVEVAGLHPAGDTLPYILGHLMWVPSETGASYGDLDPQYLTASYRVYLNEPDAKKVFAYIKKLQATSPLWNAETSNCTAFIGSIATFMGLKVPFHLMVAEEYVNSLKEVNGGRHVVQLT